MKIQTRRAQELDDNELQDGADGELEEANGLSPQIPVPGPPINTPQHVPDSNEHPETHTPNFIPIMDDIKTAVTFINALTNSSLQSDIEPLDPMLLHSIQHPPEQELPKPTGDECLSIELFMAVSNASQETYNAA